MLTELTKKYKAVSDEVRIRILALLANGELCVCDIENALKMSQPRISQHLIKLKNAGLIKDKKVGHWSHYFITDEGKKFFKKSFLGILDELKNDALIKDDAKNFKKYSDNKC